MKVLIYEVIWEKRDLLLLYLLYSGTEREKAKTELFITVFGKLICNEASLCIERLHVAVLVSVLN